MNDLLSSKNLVDITPELIEKLTKELKLTAKNVNDFKEMKEMGARWNTKRKSLVFPPEFDF